MRCGADLMWCCTCVGRVGAPKQASRHWWGVCREFCARERDVGGEHMHHPGSTTACTRACSQTTLCWVPPSPPHTHPWVVTGELPPPRVWWWCGRPLQQQHSIAHNLHVTTLSCLFPPCRPPPLPPRPLFAGLLPLCVHDGLLLHCNAVHQLGHQRQHAGAEGRGGAGDGDGMGGCRPRSSSRHTPTRHVRCLVMASRLTSTPPPTHTLEAPPWATHAEAVKHIPTHTRPPKLHPPPPHFRAVAPCCLVPGV